MPDPHHCDDKLQTLNQKLAFAERLLTGVAMATNVLLNAQDYRASIQNSLRILGEATQVDRVYIFQCHSDLSTGQPLASQKWEWVGPGIVPEIDNPELQDLPFDDFLPRWHDELAKEREISGLVRDFPASEREILEPQNILSIVVVPIAARHQFWGFMGFDDCHRGHLWNPSEINALKSIANSFGGAFTRQEAEHELQKVNESLEARIQQRTSELEASTALANRANRAKSDFLANMSHELRTPLNGILGCSQILQQSKKLEPRELSQASIIEQCGQHLLTLINDILDLSKIESKRMEVYPSNVDFPSFMQAIIEMFSIQAHQKNIRFSYSLDSFLPKGIWVDKQRLSQVLFNLISNALKFTEEGEVEIRVTTQYHLNRAKAEEDCQIHFEITDTGAGISEADLAKIFAPFEQVGEISKRSKGTGLGLAISQNIVEMMGGVLKVDSILGKGSKFSFAICCPEVPIEEQVNLARSKQTILGYRGRTRKILIVDDYWENRAVLIHMLKPLGFECCEAEDGQQGLEQALAEKPDLIILDLVMPVMDGYGLLKVLRQQEATKNTSVIVSSASVFKSDQQRSLDAGGDYFLSKPVQFRELLQTLQQCLVIDWVYEEALPTPEIENFVDQPMLLPTQDKLLLLQKIARSGLIQAFLKELTQLDETSAQYRKFTQELRALAQDFRLKDIQASLEAAIAQSPAPHQTKASLTPGHLPGP